MVAPATTCASDTLHFLNSTCAMSPWCPFCACEQDAPSARSPCLGGSTTGADRTPNATTFELLPPSPKGAHALLTPSGLSVRLCAPSVVPVAALTLQFLYCPPIILRTRHDTSCPLSPGSQLRTSAHTPPSDGSARIFYCSQRSPISPTVLPSVSMVSNVASLLTGAPNIPSTI